MKSVLIYFSVINKLVIRLIKLLCKFLFFALQGRMARKAVEGEKRKQEAQERVRAEAEANRPRAQKLLRPKGKSYIGF